MDTPNKYFISTSPPASLNPPPGAGQGQEETEPIDLVAYGNYGLEVHWKSVRGWD
jgi:hypothetical protein